MADVQGSHTCRHAQAPAVAVADVDETSRAPSLKQERLGAHPWRCKLRGSSAGVGSETARSGNARAAATHGDRERAVAARQGARTRPATR